MQTIVPSQFHHLMLFYMKPDVIKIIICVITDLPLQTHSLNIRPELIMPTTSVTITKYMFVIKTE